MKQEKEYQTLNMCDFCVNSFPACEARPIFGKTALAEQGDIAPDAIIACDKYRNPVASLLNFC
ncbi:MAG: hypothetical protein HY580_04480 [Nitrospinae bacterium]|nr:hypothetical protein [Nitrospinota bacterium]